MGLTFKTKYAVIDKAWIFVFGRPRHISLTMMFVLFPIDAISLDENKKVIELIRNMRPWKFYSFKRQCSYVIELDKGLISKIPIKVGDLLGF